MDAIAWKYGNSVIGTWSSKDLNQKGIGSIIQFYCTTESSRPEFWPLAGCASNCYNLPHVYILGKGTEVMNSQVYKQQTTISD